MKNETRDLIFAVVLTLSVMIGGFFVWTKVNVAKPKKAISRNIVDNRTLSPSPSLMPVVDTNQTSEVSDNSQSTLSSLRTFDPMQINLGDVIAEMSVVKISSNQKDLAVTPTNYQVVFLGKTFLKGKFGIISDEKISFQVDDGSMSKLPIDQNFRSNVFEVQNVDAAKLLLKNYTNSGSYTISADNFSFKQFGGMLEASFRLNSVLY